MKNPKVLIACEESQRVCAAFRARGIEAYSCDIQEPSGGHPEWHILGDVTKYLNPMIHDVNDCWIEAVTFRTMDGAYHFIPNRWDMIIGHPPCTYLSCAGAERTFSKVGGIIDQNRYDAGVEASAFFAAILNANCGSIAVENPNIMRNKFGIRKPDQKIHPYMFGEPWYKATNLWLKNLPKLEPTEIVTPTGYWVQRSGKRAKGSTGGHRDPKIRAKTFPGIAAAMAEQWGDYLLSLEE